VPIEPAAIRRCAAMSSLTAAAAENMPNDAFALAGERCQRGVSAVTDDRRFRQSQARDSARSRGRHRIWRIKRRAAGMRHRSARGLALREDFGSRGSRSRSVKARSVAPGCTQHHAARLRIYGAVMRQIGALRTP
jgi:hypothetical protein